MERFGCKYMCSSIGCMSVCLHYNTNVTLKDWCKIHGTFLLVLDMPRNPQSLSPNFSLVHAQVDEAVHRYTDQSEVNVCLRSG